MNNLKCCLCCKASVEFITETIKYLAFEVFVFHLHLLQICSFFPLNVLSTYCMPGMLGGFGDKTTNKTDMVTTLMVFIVRGSQGSGGSTRERNNYTPNQYKICHIP